MDKKNGTNNSNNDIVVSSRVRLARNMKKFPFPTIKDSSIGKKVIGEVFQSIAVIMKENEKVFQRKEIKDLTGIKRLQMMEKHLISPQLAKNYETGAVVHNEQENLIIMINEEDHIRIQALLPGFQLEETLLQANQIDDVIEEQIDYAFDERFGYLTACPTNVGTGMRASVMLHLPALSMSDQIHGMLQFANKIGLAVRGVYGEGSDFIGNLYQISNQVTLGISEQEIIEKLKEVTLQIINKERVLREDLIQEQSVEIEDQVFRSLGILKAARMVSIEEGMKRLSDVQLGISLGLLDNLELAWIHQLITLIQPGSLQADLAKELDVKAQNIHRGTLLRRKFGNK